MTEQRRFDPALVLLVLLLASHFAITVYHYHHPVIGDEPYWIDKARYLSLHGWFPPIDAVALAAEQGRAWATADWRPQGYTVFVALCSLGDFSRPDSVLRLRVTIAQFLLLAAVLIVLYRIAARAGVPRPAAAFILGAAPWTFEFVNEINVDALNAFVATVALLLLGRWLAAPERRASSLFWASLAASVTLLLRPDMIVMAPVIVGLAILLRWSPRLRDVLAATAAFALVLGAQVAYRTWFTGHVGVFGGDRPKIVNGGAFHWTETWAGTEKEGYDFVYNITVGQDQALPNRAFGDENERRRVQRIIERVRARGQYSQEDDAEFERLARDRAKKFPVLVATLRLWHAAHLWLNVENPGPLLTALAPVPRATRRPIYGGLLLVRLMIYALAVAATLRAMARLRRGEADAFDRLTLLMAGFIIVRTLFIGAVLNWKVHRYMLAAWPAMLWCACAALRRSRGARG